MNKVRCVFSLKKFFIEKNYYGFILELIQIKSEFYLINACLENQKTKKKRKKNTSKYK